VLAASGWRGPGPGDVVAVGALRQRGRRESIRLPAHPHRRPAM